MSALILNTVEDRPDCMVGVMLLALSLEKHSPTVQLRVWGLHPGSATWQWFAGRPNVMTAPFDLEPGLGGWNFKPTILLAALEGGAERTAWIDADIVVTGDLAPLLDGLPDDTLVATEEILYPEEPQGSSVRMQDWDLAAGHPVARTVNSSFVAVTSQHRPLLIAWREMLRSPHYRRAQRMPFLERPIGLRSDQDALTALLGSQVRNGVALHLLREGREVAHCMQSLGFRTLPRIRAAIRGLPVLVHAQGEKPWQEGVGLSTELSPYGALAAAYRDALPPGMLDWVRPRRRTARILNNLFLGHPTLRGLPLTALRELRELLGTWRPARSGHATSSDGTRPSSSP